MISFIDWDNKSLNMKTVTVGQSASSFFFLQLFSIDPCLHSVGRIVEVHFEFSRSFTQITSSIDKLLNKFYF